MAISRSTTSARVELNDEWGYVVSDIGTGGWDRGRNANHDQSSARGSNGQGCVIVMSMRDLRDWKGTSSVLLRGGLRLN